MRNRFFSSAALIMLASTGLAFAVQPTDMDGAKTPAGKVVAKYLEYTWSKNKNPAEAKKLLHPNFVEHGYLGMNESGGGMPPGVAGMGAPGGTPPSGAPAGGPPGEGMGAPPGGGNGGATITPVKIIAQGDLVFVQGHGQIGQGNGDLMWILYRVKDGKIIEHWDTHNEIPDDQVGKQW